jgi:transposase-like protein
MGRFGQPELTSSVVTSGLGEAGIGSGCLVGRRATVGRGPVAERFGVSRQAVHRWRRWYEDEGLDGLADRSHRPHAHPAQISPEVEAAICELRCPPRCRAPRQRQDGGMRIQTSSLRGGFKLVIAV